MPVRTSFIEGITGDQYDRLLAGGWFRSKNIVFKSDLVCIDGNISSVRHIRYALESFSFKKAHRKLLRRNDEKFTVHFIPAHVSKRAEELYEMQKARFKGFIHSQLSDIILSDISYFGFNTMTVHVYDENKLIAASYFDVGTKSSASLICVYNPEYSGYSLGIYTMLKEIEYLKRNGYKYYYPGYVLDRPSCFDYKLTLGECQWKGKDGRWLKKLRPSDTTLAMKLDEKMAELRLRLAIDGYAGKLVRYPYFSTAYLTEGITDLVKYSCYFLIEDRNISFAAAYDLESDEFVVFTLSPSETYFVQLDCSVDYLMNDNYELRLMKIDMVCALDKLNHLINERLFKLSSLKSMLAK